MSALDWQKSSFSGDQANCLYVAATPTGTVHLRESDTPDAVLTTTPTTLATLIRTLARTPHVRVT
ncbi:DUF397 domain-containing protein [Streptomyces ureilyticus]|uniref:DUF397 domain-containing protein n=1 Tax=Streptomyces ureilyticus TaxID=1775131 RepID=A0ABX0DMN8_9ACTN|nr:DUF397 domain-containing protein [Streptomyces ureilyticus]NGO41984.1 DUF397 domain-containing protein [Streptomyces ureilyticus]